MSTDPTSLTTPVGTTPANLRDDRLTYGAVHLDVIDLERSLGFWRELIGLAELSSAPDQVRLGVDGRALVVLRPVAVRAVARGDAGLYHLAIHLPDATEFARVLARLGQARVPQSPTDHIFSKATYLHDPDGILLELTLETPERFRSIEIGPQSVIVTDSEGRARGATEPLDIAAALAPLEGGDPQQPLPSGSYIGHVHLHVRDLRDAYRFYREVVGFDEHSLMTPIGMADLSAGGRFWHRLALNDWHGPDATQPAPGTAGMRRYELALHGERQLAQLGERAVGAGAVGGGAVGAGTDGAGTDGGGAVGGGADGGGAVGPPGGLDSITLHDPAGNEIVVTEAPAPPREHHPPR